MSKRKWSGWRWFWVAWIAAFVVGETAALLSRGDDTTLSEFVWDFVVSNPLGWLAMLGLLSWLWYHFLMEKDKN